jgi:CDK-activating kinase assembly factor MAT1
MMPHRFNRGEEDFATLLEYNNYLEEMEDLIQNLTEGINVEACNKKLKAYEEAYRYVATLLYFITL